MSIMESTLRPHLNTKPQIMKIIIDNPCHENWNAMTPNAKGAFCLSCQKNVIDFSKQTVEEIKNFFSELPQQGSVCGKFREEQLNEISFEYFFMQFRKWKYFQKAAVIAFFVFGFNLFGMAQSNINKHPQMLKGEVAVILPPDSVKTKLMKPVRPAGGKDTLKNKPVIEEPMIMGGPRYIPDPEKKPKKPLPKSTPVKGANRPE
jgi:hypothetical protein